MPDLHVYFTPGGVFPSSFVQFLDSGLLRCFYFPTNLVIAFLPTQIGCSLFLSLFPAGSDGEFLGHRSGWICVLPLRRSASHHPQLHWTHPHLWKAPLWLQQVSFLRATSYRYIRVKLWTTRLASFRGLTLNAIRDKNNRTIFSAAHVLSSLLSSWFTFRSFQCEVISLCTSVFEFKTRSLKVGT